jgi:hypothetical protein
LTFIYYFRGDKTRIIYATLRAINLAEHAQLAPVLVVRYSNLGDLRVVPLRKRAEHYLGIASDLTKQLAMPTVTANVSLLSGLYWTSVGEWQGQVPRDGLEQACAWAIPGVGVNWRFLWKPSPVRGSSARPMAASGAGPNSSIRSVRPHA